MTTISDEDLIAAWQGGEAGAFDEIVSRFSARVYGICYRYFGNAEEAEDAAQETFLALHRRGSSFRGQAKFSTWLYRVTTNVCHDLGRKRGRRPTTLPFPDHGAPAETPLRESAADDAMVAAELGVEITTALRALDETQRLAVVLHDVYGYPYEDIAERTGVALGTVKSRIHRGHARLAATLVHLRQSSVPGTSDAAGSADGEPSGPNGHLTE